MSLLAERAAKGGKKPKPVRAKKTPPVAANDAGDTPPDAKAAKKKAAPKRKAPRPKAKARRRHAPEPMAKGRVPTRDELLAFIKESATPVGKREIARAYGMKGDQRIELKQLLRDLRDAATLPPTAPRHSRIQKH